MQNQLNALALRGEKVATAGQWRQEYIDRGEDFDAIAERQVLLGEADALLGSDRDHTGEENAVRRRALRVRRGRRRGIRIGRGLARQSQNLYTKEGPLVGDDDLVVCAWFRLPHRSIAVDLGEVHLLLQRMHGSRSRVSLVKSGEVGHFPEGLTRSPTKRIVSSETSAKVVLHLMHEIYIE
jgi:hypothetical protein